MAASQAASELDDDEDEEPIQVVRKNPAVQRKQYSQAGPQSKPRTHNPDHFSTVILTQTINESPF